MEIHSKDGVLSCFIPACKNWLQLEMAAIEEMHKMLGEPAMNEVKVELIPDINGRTIRMSLYAKRT